MVIKWGEYKKKKHEMREKTREKRRECDYRSAKRQKGVTETGREMRLRETVNEINAISMISLTERPLASLSLSTISLCVCMCECVH